MALAQIYNSARALLYGYGLGEKPAIRLSAANAGENTASPPLVSFALAAGEGAKVKVGETLGVYSPTSAAKAHVVYVTSIATDTITGVNGGMVGAPEIVADGAVDSVLFEQDPLVTSHEIHAAIDTIVARHLWPDIYNVETKTFASPDLVDGQHAVDADVEEIMSAWQALGGTSYSVAFQRQPILVDTTLASTGKMAEFDWMDGGVGYYTAKTKITVADDDGTPNLTRLISTGAAALLLGGIMVEATIENTKKDNADAVSQRSSVGGILWRDFLTLKQQFAWELGRQNESRILIDRG